MKYPSRDAMLSWYREEGTPQNIIDHVTVVNRIAMFLAGRLEKAGISTDMKLVDCASFLHDLDKWRCIRKTNRLGHGFETEEMLKEKGYPGIGHVARMHNSDFIQEGLSSWEERIVYYADMRVLHTEIVSIEERLKDMQVRYPSDDKESTERTIRMARQLEVDLFSHLDFGPDELKGLLLQEMPKR